MYDQDDGLCRALKKDGSKCYGKRVLGLDYCVFHKGNAAPIPEATPEEALMAPEPRTPEPPKTLPYPWKDGNVNENSAIRMIQMVHPDCPMDSNPEILRRDGTSIPNPRYTGEPNCQLTYKLNEQGRWDVAKCIELGHEPYYTIFRKTVVEDVEGKDGYVVETKTRVLREKRLNIIQVSDNARHTNKTEVALALARGSVMLDGFLCTCSKGADPHFHQTVCEFRNCSAPWTLDSQYGRYCNERHARLVAADAKKMILPVGGDPYTEDQARDERDAMLETINIGVRRG